MNKHVIALGLILCFAVIGCEKKLEPVPVGEMNEYRDPGYGFRIKYPKNWINLGATGKAKFCKSQEVANKFIDPRSGEAGAQVIAEVIRYDGKTPQEMIQTSKDELKQAAQLSADESITAAGKPATKIPYSIKVTTKTNITGYEIFVPGDTAMYKLNFAGYGEHYEAHVAVFDAMLKSFEVPIVVAKKPDVWQPSANIETYTSNFFTMQYPDNLEFVTLQKSKFDYSMEMRADRRDCSIHIDVFGAKGLTVDKVWDQNKAKYKARAAGETTIDGNKTYWVDYAPMANVNSRAYFLVKNDKVVRPTINYYTAQKDIYFPVFEKCVISLKLK